MLIFLCCLSGCFHTTTAGFSSCNRDHMIRKDNEIYHTDLWRKLADSWSTQALTNGHRSRAHVFPGLSLHPQGYSHTCAMGNRKTTFLILNPNLSADNLRFCWCLPSGGTSRSEKIQMPTKTSGVGLNSQLSQQVTSFGDRVFSEAIKWGCGGQGGHSAGPGSF